MGGIQPVKWIPRSGGLNANFGYEEIQNGDLVSARNVRGLGGDINGSPDYVPIRGNKYQYEPSTAVVQNQVIRITITGDGTATAYNVDWILNTINGQNICTFTEAIIGDDFVTTAANIDTAFGVNLPAGYTYSFAATTIDANSGYIDFEILDIPGHASPTGWGWIFTNETIFSEVVVDIVITQQGIDDSLLGYWTNIGSFDMNGEDFQLWTTRQGLPIEYDITGCVDDGTGLIEISVASHSITVGEAVRVAFVLGTLTTNDLEIASTGTWIVSSVTATTIVLAATVFPGGETYLSGGIIYQNILALSEIGVAVEDINTDVINYTRLLRSWEMDFRAIKQADVTGDIQNLIKNIYLTDEYNTPRAFYYKGPFITDGALTTVNPFGLYTFGTISDELKLIQTNNFNSHMVYTDTPNAGGNLKAGNKEYYYRFLTSNFNATEWSEPTNPINTYSASASEDALQLKGNIEGARTGKINIFLISGIPVTIYKYVELAVVEYSGLSFSATLIRQDILTGNDTQIIQHSGFENNQQELDAGTLNLKYAQAKLARNIGILNNRLFLSKLTYQQLFDFTDFAKTFRHSIEKIVINDVGTEVGTNANYKYGEYFDPMNVNTRVGYMMNECERFMVKFKLKNAYGGGTTLDFWVDDIVIDCNPENIDPAYPDNRRDPGSATDYNLTTPYDPEFQFEPYVWYVDFHGINLDYLINGIPVRDLVEEIIIERAEGIAEVLATGYIVPAVSDSFQADVGGDNYTYSITGDPLVWGEYMFINGLENSIQDNPTYIEATLNTPGYLLAFTERRTAGSFYWMDNEYNMPDIEVLPDDVILTFGSPEKQSGFFPTNKGAGGFNNYYAVYNGTTRDPLITPALKPTPNVVLDGKMAAFGEEVPLTGGITYRKYVSLNPTAGTSGSAKYQKSLVLLMTDPIDDTNDLGNDDYGFYICQYYRRLSNYGPDYNPDTSKFGNRLTSKGVPTASYITLTTTLASPTVQGTLPVFGGSVFCQKTFFKNRYPYRSTSIASADIGFGGGLGLYSVNKINSQMRCATSAAVEIYPNIPLLDWLQAVGDPEYDRALYYNFGYNIRNTINRNAVYNPNIDDIIDAGATIIYSDLKPDGSIVDNYRIFLPLNVKFLSKSDGNIAHHTISNGELITIQTRRTLRQFVNTTGMLTTVEGSEIILGDGAVLARQGQTLTTYGSNHKWSHIKGKTQGGHDVDFYYDIENKTIIKISVDGSVDIGLRANYSSFLEKYTKWIEGKDTPAYDWGICGVWYQKTKEAIWTFRGRKVVAAFDIGTDYLAGDVVEYLECSTWNTFEQVDNYFIALTDIPAGSDPQEDVNAWERIPVDNPDYFSYFTLVWSEIKNKFQCHHGYHPKIYIKMKNYFLTPRTAGNTGKVYRHEKGNYCEWYDDGTTKQTDDYSFEAVVNNNVEVSKDGNSVMVESLIAPALTEVRTNTQKTHMDSGEYTFRESAWASPILMDEAITAKNPTGSNKGDGSRLFGKYLRIKLQGATNTYNEFKSFVMKVRMRDKTFNK